MGFKYRSDDIFLIANAPKTLETDGEIRFVRHKEKGLKGDWTIQMPDNPWARLRLQVTAGIPDQLYSFRSVLLLDNFRIRGVDYSPVARTKRYKEHIPEGWHQNIVNPALPIHDPNNNKHEKLLDFHPTDFMDFTRKTCMLWNIKLVGEESSLL